MPGSIPGSATADSRERVEAGTRVVATAASAGTRRTAWTRFVTLVRRKPLGALSAVILCGVVAVAILAPVVAPYDPYQFNLDHRGLPVRLQAPNATFLLGTDALGRDVLSRLVYGARVSLLVGFASVLVGTLLGTGLGLASGYCEGRVDSVLQRGVDTVMAVPGIVLALAVMSVLGQSLVNVIVVIAIVIAPGASRVVRGAVLAVKQNTFVDAAYAAGAAPWRIVLCHILPNVFAPILVIATVWLGNAIVIEAALSFLGLGTQPPEAAWGSMLSTARTYIDVQPWLSIFPGGSSSRSSLPFFPR